MAQRNNRYTPGKALLLQVVSLNRQRRMQHRKSPQIRPDQMLFIARERLLKQKRPASNLVGREYLGCERQANM